MPSLRKFSGQLTAWDDPTDEEIGILWEGVYKKQLPEKLYPIVLKLVREPSFHRTIPASDAASSPMKGHATGTTSSLPPPCNLSTPFSRARTKTYPTS